jgi:hypothetical protein
VVLTSENPTLAHIIVGTGLYLCAVVKESTGKPHPFSPTEPLCVTFRVECRRYRSPYFPALDPVAVFRYFTGGASGGVLWMCAVDVAGVCYRFICMVQ